MQPRVWTELFFLDEATALAAGHRPCAYCRRKSYNRYRDALLTGSRDRDQPFRAKEIDGQLHAERLSDRAEKALIEWRSTDLPNGAIVQSMENDGFDLIYDNRLVRWSAEGYCSSRPLLSKSVKVLTPPLSLLALQNGYEPLYHPSLSKFAQARNGDNSE